MYSSFNHKFKKDMVFLHPGDYYASGSDEIIGTLLGSCIAVVLIDKVRKTAGMNHFMLPAASGNISFISNNGKYGMYAMELLINSLIKLGAAKKTLTAKIFGGATLFKSITGKYSHIAQDNIHFTFNYLQTEEIPIESSDTGGDEGRKIFLFPQSGKVLMKKIAKSSISGLAAEEKEYILDVREKYIKD